MTDYAAAAVQPIVQGLLTVASLGGPVTFTGRGAKLIPSLQPSPNGVGRDNTHPQGVFVLTLDVGLPGNAGAVEPFPNNAVPPTLAPAAPLPRTLVDVRAPLVGGPPALPAPTTLTSVSVAYGNFTGPASVTPPFDGSLTQVMIVVAAGAALSDPFTPNANGLEVIVWAGVESP